MADFAQNVSRKDGAEPKFQAGAGGRIRQPAVPDRKGLKLLIVCAAATLALGCGKTGSEHLAEARQHLADADYEDAIGAAESGLVVAQVPATVWGLELVALEAHARAGHGEQTKQQLMRLERAHPARIPPTEYSATAHQLKTAGQRAAAIEILDLGAKRFPDNAIIAKMIGDSAAAGSDPAELEMLRSLGYIE